MVESYGLYDPEQVDRISEIQRESHEPPIPPSASNAPLQRPVDGPEDHGRVSDSPEEAAATAPVETLQGRFIVCPYCGQQIPFSPDLIGGV